MSWLALEGKTAVVTGGASGIGKAVVQAFLDNGANVVVCDMNPQTPEYDLHETSGEFLYVPTDVTKADSVKAMVEAGKAKFGKLDILVNNAGINIPRLLVDKDDPYGKYELDENVFDKVSAVNIKGVYLCAQALGHEFVKMVKALSSICLLKVVLKVLKVRASMLQLKMLLTLSLALGLKN